MASKATLKKMKENMSVKKPALVSKETNTRIKILVANNEKDLEKLCNDAIVGHVLVSATYGTTRFLGELKCTMVLTYI